LTRFRAAADYARLMARADGVVAGTQIIWIWAWLVL
jgi:hypothetical protein